MTLPRPVADAIAQGLGGRVEQVTPLSTGGGTAAARISVAGMERLAKWETGPSAGLGPCGAEVRGLRLLAGTGALRVPEVELAVEAEGDCPAFFVAEWIAGPQRMDRDAAGAALGQQLAALHQHSAPAYGLDHDNFCGASPQPNGWHASWTDFYRERRLRPHLHRAARQGLLPAQRRKRLEQLLDRLQEWIPPAPEPPALLHGDLWGGNWLVDAAGSPVLIDPAVSYGHREAELALCHLFGGFPRAFFAAYDAAAPPLPGRAERLPLYQLYHLLNHLNLFGESYGAQCDAILARYVG